MGMDFADNFRAELDLYIELQVVPVREAFLGVLTDQLSKLDERIGEFPDEQISRADMARLDLRLLVENWGERQERRYQGAMDWLSEHMEVADAIGSRDEIEMFVKAALADQDLILYKQGIDATADVIGEHNVADFR